MNQLAPHLHELAALKVDIDRGLTDLAEGRVKGFDASRIIEQGRKLLAARSPAVMEDSSHEPARPH